MHTEVILATLLYGVAKDKPHETCCSYVAAIVERNGLWEVVDHKVVSLQIWADYELWRWLFLGATIVPINLLCAFIMRAVLRILQSCFRSCTGIVYYVIGMRVSHLLPEAPLVLHCSCHFLPDWTRSPLFK